MQKARRPLASILLAALMLSIASSDGQIVPAAEPSSVLVPRGRHSAFLDSFAPTLKDLWRVSSSNDESGTFGPQKIGFGPREMILDGGESPTIVRGDKKSQMAQTRVRRLERLKIRLKSVLFTFFGFSRGEKYALASAKNNQILAFIDGKILWSFMSPSGALADFVHEPGNGRKPSSDSGSRSVGGRPVVAATTTVSTVISQTTADSRYVNVSGDTMDGALTITRNGLGLLISGTASGNTFHATRLLTVSGSSIFDGNARFNSTITLGGVTYTFPTSEGASSGKVLKTNAAGQLSWSDDNNSASGLSQSLADERYVNTSGDAMTGALTINLSSGFIGLKLINTASGNILHAEKDLTSSGTLTVSGIARFKSNISVVGTISGGALQIMNGSSYVLGSLGIGTTTPKAKLEVLGSFSGSRLYAASAFSGAGLTTCSALQKLLWNSTTQQFSCSTDLNTIFGSGNVFTISDARYVRTSGGTMTGALTINLSSGFIGLKIIQTASGNILHAEKDLTSSGTLTVSGITRFKNNLNVVGTISGGALQIMNGTSYVLGSLGIGTTTPKAKLEVLGSFSGSRLYAASAFSGAGLSSCSAAGQKLLWNSTTQQFSCSTDLNTVFGSGNVLTIGDARYVNTSGDTMTGALTINLSSDFLGLKIIQTASGNILHAEKDLTSSGTLTVSGITRFKNNLNVVGTISGGALQIMNGTSYVLGSLGIGTTTPKAKLEVLGSFSGSRLYAASTFSGAGLSSCSAAGQKLLWNSTTQQFSCSTDLNTVFGSGNVLTIGDARYVNTSGDTMTGALTINLSSGFLGLKIIQTASGNILHAEKDLTSSGTLTVSGITRFKNNLNVVGTISGGALQIMNGTSYVLGSLGIGTTTPKAKLEVLGSFSGSRLYAASTFSGAGLTSCSAAGQKLLWNSTLQQFSCGTDLHASSVFGSGNVFTIGDARYVRTSGGSMTGALTIRLSGGDINTLGLNVMNTISGAILHAEKLLTSSGGLIFEGAASGSSLYIATSLRGAGLSDCTGTNKLLWDSITGRFSCSIDIAAGTGLSIATGDSRYVNQSGDTMTGALTINLSSGFLGLKIIQTASGNILHAEKDLTSSGTLTVSGVARFKNNLNTVGTISGGALNIMNGTSYVLGSLGIGTTSPKAKLEVLGSFSGSRLYAASAFSGAGLTTCSAAGQKLLWNSTTQQFSCSTDLNTVFGSGNVLTIGDARYVNTSGDTMTGALTINLSSGFLGLKIIQTASGNILHAEKDLTSSGTLTVSGIARFKSNLNTVGTISGGALNIMNGTSYVLGSFGIGTTAPKAKLEVQGSFSGSRLYAASAFSGAGLSSCSAAGQKLLWNSSMQQFSCSTDLNTVFGSGNVLTIGDARYVNTSGDTMTGALTINLSSGFLGLKIIQTASGNILHAEKDLTSSGTLTVSGITRFKNNLNVVGTISGSALQIMNGTSYVLGSLGIGTTSPKAKLEVLGSFSGSRLYAASAFSGAGLTTCSAAGQKLLWNSTTQQFSCSTDLNTIFGSGNVLTIGDARYVNTSGDTMTGALTINLSSGFLGLRILQTASGNILHAEKDLTSSGTLTVSGVARFKSNLNTVGTISGGALNIMNGTSTILGSLGIGTTAPKAKLEVLGSFSGSRLYAASAFSGAGLTTCSAAGQKLLWNSITQQFSCSTDLNTVFGSGNVFTIGDARYVNTSGDTMTGALTIRVTGGNMNTLGLNVINTISGAILHAEKTLTSSGGLVFEGAASGSSLYLSSSLQGAGLTNCTGSNKLLWDSTTGRFSCGTDQTAGSGLDQNSGDVRYVNIGGDTMTGALTINLSSGFIGLKIIQAASGNILHAEKDLTSSGTLTVSGVARFKNNLNTVGTISGGALNIMNGTSYVFGNLGIGTTTPKVKLEVLGSFSGSRLYAASAFSGAGLTTCSAAGQKLLWNSTTQQFSCGTDLGSVFGSGNVFNIGDARYVRTSGSTMTGALTINLSSGFIGLKILQTASGNILHAEKSLSSSGTIIAKGNVTTTQGTFITRFGLTFLSGSSLSEMSGFNQYVNFREGIGTDSSIRLTSQGNLKNIGSIQAGETLLTAGGTFATKVDYVTGTTPYSVAIGDLNGDGKADIAVANNGSSSVSVFINTGTGSYATRVNYSTGIDPYSVAIGDINGDGKPDLAVANFSSTSVSVFLNKGNGTFATQVTYVTGAFPVSVAIADLNGDGKADLAVVNQADTSVSVFLNKGNGTFASKVDYTTASNPISVAVGELNEDGKPDLAIANQNGNSVSLLFNNGDGTFASKVDYGAGTSPSSVAIDDLNGDLKSDVVVTNLSSTSVSVFINTGTGSFAVKVDYVVGSSPRSVRLGDLSGDGKPDLAVANFVNNSVSFLLNKGNGTFATKVDYTTGTSPYSIAVGDLNADGKSDLAVANSAGTSFSVFLNQPRTVLFASVGTGGVVGIGTSTPGAKLSVSGAVIISARGDLRNAKTDSGIALEVIGTISGSALKLMNNLSVSGTILSVGNITTRGTLSGTNLTVSHSASISGTLLVLRSITSKGSLSGATFYGAGLGSCTDTNQKILYNSTTGKFNCSTDNSGSTFGSGNTLTIGESRYVNASGDTMTGALTINLSSGFLGLKIIQTASGNILHAEKDLTSSGTLTVSGIARFKNNLNVVGTISGAALNIMNGTSYVLGSLGIGTTTPKAKLDVQGTISGTTLTISRNGSFSGNLMVVGNLTTRGTLSGATLTVSKSASISGALLVKTSITSKGSLSGVTIAGFNLGSCSGVAQKLLYNNSTQKFECGTDVGANSIGSGNVLAIGDARYVKKQGDTMTGALVISLSSGYLGLRILQMASGAMIHAEKSLTSSGLLMVTQSTIRGSGALVVEQRANSTGAYIRGSGAHINAPLLALDSSTGSSRAPHILFGYKGTFDVALWRSTGAVLNLTGHLLPGLTNKFDLGSSAKRWRSLYLSGGTMYLGTTSNQASINFNTSASRFGIDANTDGTNELSILSTGNVGIGTATPKAKLDVQGTISGTTLVISKNASISGSLIVKTSIVSRGSLSGVTIAGFNLGSCNGATTSKLLYNNSTQKFECGTDQTGAAGNTGTVLTIGNARYVLKQGDTMTGTLKSRGFLLASGTTLTEMSGWNESLNLVHSGLGTNSVTRLTNKGDLVNIGTIQSGEAHFRRGGTFAAKVDYTTGSVPRFVAIGDLNGDGKADMAVTNNSSASVSIFLNNGTGSFASKVDYTTGTNPSAVAIGDFNGDGKSDLVVGNYNGTSVSVFINNGNGTFAAKVDYTTGSHPASVATGDLNGDGKADLAVANLSSDSVSVFLNNGNGTFAAKVDYTTGTQPYTVAIGDLNGDGKADLVLVNTISNSASVLLNNGNGTFAAKVDYTTGTQPISVAIGDLNADGKPDFAVANASSDSVSVFMNNGNGTFAAKVDYTTGTLPWTIAVGDLNGDGKPDLAVTNYGLAGVGNTVSVFMNSGNGVFASKVDYTTGTSPFSITIGDLNGDGKADLAVSNLGSDTLSVLLNLSRTILYASAGTGGAVGIGTSTPGSTLAVSGSVLINTNGNIANSRADAGLALEVIGTMSGRVLHAQDMLRSSGSLIVEGTLSGATFRGAGLGSCNGANDKLLYNNTTNKFECGSDLLGSSITVFGTGNVLTLIDQRYVKKQGDTMTGALAINLTSGFIGLKVMQTASGNIIHAEKDLTSSGTLTVNGVARFKNNVNVVGTVSGAGLTIMNGTSYILGNVGIGNTSPKAKLDVSGTISGTTLTISRNGSFSGSLIVKNNLSGSSFYGAGLGDCNNATTSKLVYNNVTGKFVCATDQSASGLSFTAASNIFVNQSGDTMTGALTINLTSGYLGLVIRQTASGNILHAEKDLTSSGTLTVNGIARFKNNLNVVGTVSGAALNIMNGTSYILGNLGIGNTSPKAKLDVSGTISGTTLTISKNGSFSGSLIVKNNLSGSSFYGAGLGDCSSTSSSKLLYNNTTGKFNCGSDQTAGGLGFTTASNIFVNQSGDTMTGALTLHLSSGYLGLKVLQTASGSIFHAEKNLTSSGTIIAGTDIISRNGTAKTKGYVFYSGATLSEMSGFNEYVNLNHSGLGTNSVTRLTNNGDLVNISTIQSGEAHFRRGGTFAPKVDYTTGAAPQSVAIGDLNGDGKMDMAVANYNSTSVSVFIGTGSGLFVSKVDYTVGTNPYYVAIGDLNADGKPDLAVANASSNSVSVFLNNGNGTFASKVDYTTGTFPSAIAATDLNGDGKVDLAVTNYTNASTSVFLNNGNGTFASKVDYTTGTSPLGIATADLNGDAKADLAVTNIDSNSLSVFFNNGNGTFASKVDYSTVTGSAGIATADFNGDDKNDLVVTNYLGSSVSVFLNNGNGTFASNVDYLTGTGPQGLATADLNGDGKTDLAVANQSSGYVSVFLNNGNGTFASKVNYTTGTTSRGIATADLNGDGKSDLAVANFGNNTVSVLLNISKTILYASSGTGGAVGIGTPTPGSALSVSGAVIINRGGNLANTSADASVTLEVIGTMSGTNLTVSRSASISGALLVKTSIVSKGSLSGSTINGFNLGSCSATTKKLLYNNSTNKFECGTDLSGGFGTGNMLTIGDTRYVRIAGSTMTGTLTINLSSGYLGLKVLQTASGNILHAEKNLTSSGTIIVGTDILSRNGTAKTKGFVLFSGATLSEMSGFNEYVNLNHSGLGTNSVTRLTNQGDLVNIGTIQSGEANFRRGGTFAAKVDYTTGSSPHTVAIGDLNGDGKADMAVANSTPGTVSIFIGTGTGSFAPKVDYATGGAESVSIGDLNGDGKPDFAASDGSRVAILFNNGNGTFANRTDYVVGASSLFVVIGDLNGDGKGDLAVTNLSSDSISIFLNNGNGTFAAKVDYTTNSLPYRLAIGDLNGDGKADLAVPNYGSDLVSIFLNNGNGTFAAKVDYATGGNPRNADIGDLNGDGKADLAVANYGGDSVSIFMNNGNGTFATKVDYTTSFPPSVAIDDLNGDGKADLAVSSGGETALSIFLNNGNGTFATKVNYMTGSFPLYLATGDLNGDGKSDVAVPNQNSNTVSVFLNISKTILYASAGTGGAVGIGTSTPGSALAVSGALIINRLGSLANASADAGITLEVVGTASGRVFHAQDILRSSGSLIVEGNMSGATLQGAGLASCNGSTQKLLYNNSSKKFECGSDSLGSFGSGNVFAIGDSRYVRTSGSTMTGALTINLSSGFLGLKIIQTASGNILHAEKNLTSSGTIIAGTDILSRNGTVKTKGFVFYSGATLSEMSGFNEYINLNHSGLGTNSVVRLTNQGDLVNIGTIQSGEAHFRRGGTFAAKVDYTTGTAPVSVSIGDLNGDGKMDMAVSNRSSNTVSIFIGTGSGLFMAKVDYTTGINPEGVGIADLNGDGKADLAVANYGSNSVSIFINNGNGTFAAKVDYATGILPTPIAIGDLNGDGKSDLAVANASSATVSIFINKGNGTFAAKVDYTTGTDPSSVSLTDLNGDGKADLAVANENSDSVSIFINNGNGTFAAKVDYTTGTDPNSVSLTDLNGDGKADLAVANTSSSSVSIFLNNGNGTFAAKVDYTTGTNPYSVAIADLNGDGKADLAVANQSSFSVSIFINNGNGTFAAKVDYTTGSTPRSPVFRDLNGDGKVDIVVVNKFSDTVSILLNISKTILYASSGTGGAVGIGTSTPGSALSVSGAMIINRLGTLANASADAGITLEVVGTASGRIFHAQDVLRSSGSLIVEGNMSGATLQGAGLASCNGTSEKLLYNNSTKKFECGSDLTGSFGSGNVITIGDSRYVRTSGGTMTGALTINLTSGYLGLKVLQTASGNILHAEKSLSSSGTIIAGTDILSRNGTAKTKGFVLFSGATLSEMSGFNEYFNLVHSGLGTNSVVRLTNQGDLVNIGTIQSGEAHFRRGGIFAPKVDYTTGTAPAGVSIGDLNGDGKPDLAVANFNGNSVSVFIGTGAGLFVSKVDYTAGTGPNSVAIGDLNGDGKPDLAVANQNSSSVSIFLNNGSGIFAAKVDYTTGSLPTSVAISDLNGDGKADFAVANSGGTSVSIFLNNGNGTFAPRVNYTTGSGPYGVAAGDLNGDGKPDLVVGNESSTTVSVFLNNGNGTFAVKVDYAAGTQPGSIAIGDLNGDGKADFSVTNYGVSTVSVFLNNGNGTFAAKVDYTTGLKSISVAIGDLNGDGKGDLAVANEDSTTVSVFLNNGNGTFASGVNYTTGGGPRSVAIGDLNSDGKLDLAVANYNAGVGTAVSVFLNISKTILFASSGTGGAVGIGTSTPGSALSVSGAMIINRGGNLSNARADTGVTLEVIGTASGRTLHAQDLLRSSGALAIEGASYFGSGLTIKTNHSNAGASEFTIITDYSTSNNKVFRVSASGAVYSDARYNSNGADYAEWFRDTSPPAPLPEGRGETSLKPGEVVCIDTTQKNAVKRCENSADPNVMGIVSTNPAFVGNVISGADGIIPPGYALIGLIGQVPAKPTLENGEIFPGDSVTSASTPGFIRKANAGESTVGVALESYDAQDALSPKSNVLSPTIHILISRRNQSLTVETLEKKVLQQIEAMSLTEEIGRMVSEDSVTSTIEGRVREALRREIAPLDLPMKMKMIMDKRLKELGSGSSGSLSFGSHLTDTQLSALTEAVSEQLVLLKKEQETATGSTDMNQESRIKNQESRFSELEASFFNLQSEFSLLHSQFSVLSSHFGTGKTLHASALSLSSGATISGSLRLNGSMIVNGDFKILRSSTGTILSGSELTIFSVSGSSIEIGSLVEPASLKVIGNVTITGLATFLGDVHIKGDLVLSSRQAGFAVIPASGTAVTVTFSGAMMHMPIINASPDTLVLFAVTKITSTGFTIRIGEPKQSPITFAYVALSADQPSTVIGHAAAGETLPTLIPFNVNALGQPVSSDAVWNGCIQGRPLFDSDGIPFSCSRYHSGTTWEHPDLAISFIYNANHDPAILTIPEGYQIVVIGEQDTSTPVEGAPETALEEIVPEVSTVAGSEITSTATENSADIPETSSGSLTVEEASPELVESSPEIAEPIPTIVTQPASSTETSTETGSTIVESSIENFILDLLNTTNAAGNGGGDE